MSNQEYDFQNIFAKFDARLTQIEEKIIKIEEKIIDLSKLLIFEPAGIFDNNSDGDMGYGLFD